MKKIITYIFLVFSILSFSDSFNENEDGRTILKQEQRSEQERLQKELSKLINYDEAQYQRDVATIQKEVEIIEGE